VLIVSLEVKRAQLWDEKLEVVSEDAGKVWVHSALLQVPDSLALVSVETHHVLDH
jgi:hypothetical protein